MSLLWRPQTAAIVSKVQPPNPEDQWVVLNLVMLYTHTQFFFHFRKCELSDCTLSLEISICQSIITLKSEHRCMWRHEQHVWSYFRPAVHLWFNHGWQMSIQDWLSLFDNDPFWAVSLKLLEGIVMRNIVILDKKEGKKLLQQPTIQCTVCIGQITVDTQNIVTVVGKKYTKKKPKNKVNNLKF